MAGLLLLMPGVVQKQQPAHASIPHAREAMPVHEREPAYMRVERGVPRMSIITNPNLDYKQMSNMSPNRPPSSPTEAATTTIAPTILPVIRQEDYK